MYLFYSIFLIQYVVVYAYDKGTHSLEVERESYQYGDYYFNFYYTDANWDEAYAMCQASASRLAVVHDMARAKFLAEALSHTLVGVEDVWIGGKMVNNWQWVALKRDIPKNIVDGYPPWLNYPTKRGKYCLSLDRRNHSEPLFVELQCSLQRPFICEKSTTAQLTVKPTLSLQMKTNKSTFVVYYARVTWDEALTYCKQIGAQLATVLNIEITHQLVTLLQHLRPIIRNAWIGARKQNYGWIWTATDEVIPGEKDLETEYPPWPSDDLRNNPFKDCLVVDHHACKNIVVKSQSVRTDCQEKAIFLPESCSLKKDFICEIVPPKPRAPPNQPEIIMSGSIKYVFLRKREKWKNAVRTCELFNMTLAMPSSKQELDAIVSNLADVEYSWDHIWLGAKWNVFENQWESLNGTVLLTDHKSYLPWCKSMPLHEPYENCLNLDRDAHKVPVVYGFNCSIPQGFVCQLILNDELPLAYNSKSQVFTIHDYLLDYADAQEACQTQKSHLAVTNTMELAQNLSLMLPVDTKVWIGGEREDGVWKWSRTKEVIPNYPNESNYPPWGSINTEEGKVCLAIQSGFRRHPMFLEEPCTSRMHYVCELGPEHIPEPEFIVKRNDYLYYFFRQPETWEKANFFCIASHLRMPTIGNIELANFLSGITGTHSSFWVAGKREYKDVWRWTTNGNKITDKIIANTAYFRPSNLTLNGTDSECLLLLNDTSVERFTAEGCNKVHDFICVNYNVHADEPLTKKMDSVSEYKRSLGTLNNGIRYCESQDLEMMNVTMDLERTKKIMQLERISTIWLNIIRKNNGKWVYHSNKQPFETILKFPDRDTNYEHGVMKDCAALVLRIGGQFEIKRFECNDHAFTLCQKNSSRLVEQAEVRMTVEKVTYTASLEPRSFQQSKQFCIDQAAEMIGHLNYKEALSVLESFDYKQFWIDKEPERPTKRLIGAENAQLVMRPKTTGDSCNAYGKMSESVIRNINCNLKLSTVCSSRDAQFCKPPPIVESLKWSPAFCEENEVQDGKVCQASCHAGILFGPERITCLKGNWSYDSKPDVFPSCLDNAKQSKSLLDFIKSKQIQNKPSPPFIFAVDSGVSNYAFDVSISFVKHIANIVLLSKRRKAALILYNKDAKIGLDFSSYDTCYFSEKLKLFSRDRRFATPSYAKVLKTVYDILDGEQLQTNVILVFFALRKDLTGQNDQAQRVKMINKLQSIGVTILVLTANIELETMTYESMASVYNNELLFYRFHNHTLLRECGELLQMNKDPSVNSCASVKRPLP